VSRVGGHGAHVVISAAQIDERLQAELGRLAREAGTYAEINRAIGVRAKALGLVKPSYARVRQLVLEAREAIEDERADPSWGELLLDVDFRRRSPMAIIDKLDGVPVRLDGAGGYQPPKRRPPRA
jgi:hypothetical protein